MPRRRFPAAERPVPLLGDVVDRLVEDPAARADLAVAVVRHQASRRRDGVGVSVVLIDLVRALDVAANRDRSDWHVDAPTPLLKRGEVATRLGISERSVSRAVAAGRLPVVHVGRAARYRADDVDVLARGKAVAA